MARRLLKEEVSHRLSPAQGSSGLVRAVRESPLLPEGDGPRPGSGAKLNVQTSKLRVFYAVDHVVQLFIMPWKLQRKCQLDQQLFVSYQIPLEII